MFRGRKKSKSLSEDDIRKSLASPSWLTGVRLSAQGDVTLILEADPDNLEAAETRRIEAETRLLSMPGVQTVKSVLTAERNAPSASPSGTSGQSEPLPPTQPTQRVRTGARLSDAALQQGAVSRSAELAPIPGISRILVVASAKGGVGKSTVSVNLAAAFARQGLKVGLLDADIYGPSIPTMLGLSDVSPMTGPDNRLIPPEAHGFSSLSIGYLTDPDAPMIWRGPIVQSAIRQMLNDAQWGTPDDPLDLLIIDTPPGTGEAQLTLAQSVPVTAAIIVTTPQEVALADIRRGAAMFAKTHVPVLGIVETMSWFEPVPGSRHYPFGEGGAARMAHTLGYPVLTQLPLLPALREGGDTGVPAVLSDDAVAELFQALAHQIALEIDALKTKPAPTIIFD